MWQKLSAQHNSRLSPRIYCGVTSLRAAFTLIEISIVLVIIGLLVGGVMVGKDLIKASEIRAQIKLIEEFKTAANTFKLKYNYLPADIPPTETAQLGFFTFTGTYAGKTYLTAAGGWGSYINGYGNANGGVDTGENYVFWQHLSEAKMIAGAYGGSIGLGKYLQPDTTTFWLGGSIVNYASTSDLDIFQPRSKFAAFNNYISVSANQGYTKMKRHSNTSLPNIFSFSATPNQEFAIDSKIDDGLPDKGSVRNDGFAYGGGGFAPCVTGASPKAYDLTKTTADIIDDNCSLDILW